MSDPYPRYPGTAEAPVPPTAPHSEPEFGSPAHLAQLRTTTPAAQAHSRRVSRSWLAIGAVLAAATLASSAWGGLGSITAQQKTEAAATAGVPQHLVIEADTASVTVERGAVDRPTFTYRSAWGGMATLNQVVTSTTLTAQLDEPSRVFPSWFGTSLVVTVPRDTVLPELTVSVDTGHVDVSAGAGITSITAGTGAVSVDASGTELRVTTDTGAIDVHGATSHAVQIAAATGSVSVDLDIAPTTLLVTTETGWIEAQLPSGPYAVTTHAETGSVDDSLEHDSSSVHQVTATTGTGSIELSTR